AVTLRQLLYPALVVMILVANVANDPRNPSGFKVQRNDARLKQVLRVRFAALLVLGILKSAHPFAVFFERRIFVEVKGQRWKIRIWLDLKVALAVIDRGLELIAGLLDRMIAAAREQRTGAKGARPGTGVFDDNGVLPFYEEDAFDDRRIFHSPNPDRIWI